MYARLGLAPRTSMRKRSGMSSTSSHVSDTLSAPVRRIIDSVNDTVLYHVSAYRRCMAVTTASPEVIEDWPATPTGPHMTVAARIVAEARERTPWIAKRRLGEDSITETSVRRSESRIVPHDRGNKLRCQRIVFVGCGATALDRKDPTTLKESCCGSPEDQAGDVRDVGYAARLGRSHRSHVHELNDKPKPDE